MDYWTKAHEVKMQDQNELEQIYELKLVKYQIYIFSFLNA